MSSLLKRKHVLAATKRSYGSLVVADGASNYWKLDEPSGTVAVDSIGGKNGTISGGVTLGGITGMTFNGTTGKIATVANVTIPIVGSVEVWFKTLVTTESPIIGRGPGGTGPEIIFGLSSGAVFMWNTSDVTSTILSNNNQWHHAVYIVNNGTGSIYVDGVLTKTNAFAYATPSIKLLQIGWDQYSGFFNGSLQNLALYPLALSPAQIQSHYAAATSTYRSRVIINGASNYWPLDELTGTTANDVVGAKNGTISGGVVLGGSSGMTFNGTTGKIQTAANVAIPVISSFECWFNYTTNQIFPAGLFLGSHSIVGGSDSFFFYLNNGVPGLDFRPNGGGSMGSNATPTTSGTWHHLVWIFPSGITVQCYVDGIQLTLNNSNLATRIGSNLLFDIGFVNAYPDFFNGSLKNVAIYPLALTPAQIAAHYSLR